MEATEIELGDILLCTYVTSNDDKTGEYLKRGKKASFIVEPAICQCCRMSICTLMQFYDSRPPVL